MNAEQVIEAGLPVAAEEIARVELALLLYHDAWDLHLFFLDEDLFRLLARSPAEATFRIDLLAVVFKRGGAREIFTIEGVPYGMPEDPESGGLAAWWREQVTTARAAALSVCARLAHRYPPPLLVLTNPLAIDTRPSDTRKLLAEL
ncbi:MAG: hypothetical protein HZA54_20585 [Planctomycetes bacterium]|nr:hypothetical protein [Planctomycetota bacterium]